jgi:cell division septation protein DedD
VALYANDDQGTLLRLRPPERTVVDSATVPLPTHILMSPLGDRLYLAFGQDVAALNASTLDEVARIHFEAPVTSLVSTPSGDRVFVVTEGSNEVALIDRYSGERTESIRLPGFPRELRMDPFGRLLLARPDSGDSVWVINVGSNQLVATLPTVWRADLPNVAPEGSVATIPDRDVHVTTPGQAKPRIIVRDGAAEIWHFVFWNGFRPRAPGLDQPVVFPVDTMTFASPVGDSAFPMPARPDTQATRPPAAAVDSSPRPAPPSQWTVQLAAVLSEDRAREIAQGVRVDGARPRVVTSSVDGARVYRVIMGPYPTKLDADRVGKLSGRAYWVFEGVP